MTFNDPGDHGLRDGGFRGRAFPVGGRRRKLRVDREVFEQHGIRPVGREEFVQGLGHPGGKMTLRQADRGVHEGAPRREVAGVGIDQPGGFLQPVSLRGFGKREAVKGPPFCKCWRHDRGSNL